MGGGGRWSSGSGGWEENTIILGWGGGVGVGDKCSVQGSFVIKIVYTVNSQCLSFFSKAFPW